MCMYLEMIDDRLSTDPRARTRREYTEKDGQLDVWLAEQGQKPEVHVDDMVEALDPPSKQCVLLVAVVWDDDDAAAAAYGGGRLVL